MRTIDCLGESRMRENFMSGLGMEPLGRSLSRLAEMGETA